MLCIPTSSVAIAIALYSIQALAAQCTVPAILNTQENIWRTRTLHATSLYRAKVNAAVEAIKDEDLKARASKVADVGTFTWMKSPDDIQAISTLADEVPCDEILGIVIDNLPYKKAPSNAPAPEPEYNESTEDAYKSLFIEPLATTLKSHPNTAFAVIIEPDAFPQYFNATSTSTPSTQEKNLVRSYRKNIPVALHSLGADLPNVVVYIDVGHSNSLDWALLRSHTADALGEIYGIAERPGRVRGFASNVAGWNAWDLTPGEFARSDDSRDIRPSNEKTFIHILSSALSTRGVPAHAILDTSRNGVSGLRYTWDEWCNVDGAGLGARPGVQTGDGDGDGDEGEKREDVLDGFVWAKRPGESDGVSSERGGDALDCAALSAVRPAPERDVWFQGFFEMLVRNADPEL